MLFRKSRVKLASTMTNLSRGGSVYEKSDFEENALNREYFQRQNFLLIKGLLLGLAFFFIAR